MLYHVIFQVRLHLHAQLDSLLLPLAKLHQPLPHIYHTIVNLPVVIVVCLLILLVDHFVLRGRHGKLI